MAHDVGNLDDVVLKKAEKEFPNKQRTASNIMKMISGGMRPDLPESTPPCIAELIYQCWQGLPELRPTAYELIQILTHAVRPQLLNPQAKFNLSKEMESVAIIRRDLRRRSAHGDSLLVNKNVFTSEERS